MSLVWNVVVRQSRSIFAALVVLSILLVVAATVIYFFEYEAQPDSFESIPQSPWWAITTMATVGYGDMAPITPIGRLIGGIAMVFGIAMFAVPAGILASGFAEELRKRDFVVNWPKTLHVFHSLLAWMPLLSLLSLSYSNHGVSPQTRLLCGEETSLIRCISSWRVKSKSS
ncbi:MAG: hypothetical protein CM1200mP18_04030 [Gammaproteobacteria bacterium]|nr:MAG: hypothetical protein CM1200mP18_04030 [Gammaproteobacteria bacterium]